MNFHGALMVLPWRFHVGCIYCLRGALMVVYAVSCWFYGLTRCLRGASVVFRGALVDPTALPRNFSVLSWTSRVIP